MQLRKNHWLLRKMRKVNILCQPVLDMKWENNDINVAVKVKIPRFSKLDDTETPLRLSETSIEKRQILVLKLLMKRLAYVRHAVG